MMVLHLFINVVPTFGKKDTDAVKSFVIPVFFKKLLSPVKKRRRRRRKRKSRGVEAEKKKKKKNAFLSCNSFLLGTRMAPHSSDQLWMPLHSRIFQEIFQPGSKEGVQD